MFRAAASRALAVAVSRTAPSMRSSVLATTATRWYNTEPAQPIVYPAPRVSVRGKATDFTADAVVNGDITSLKLSDYKGKWLVFFWYPKDFTFVCPTEIISFSDRVKEFKDIGCEVVAASVDTPEVHLAWVRTPRKNGGLGHMQIPLVSDPTRSIANDYGVLIKDIGITLRGLFVIDPEGVVQQATINNLPVGRNVDEVLRLVKGYQYVATHDEVCPAGWTPGAATMVAHPDKSLEYFRSTAEFGAGDGLPLGKVVPATSVDQVASTIATSKAVVLFHGASWCGKCKMITPFVADLSERFPGVTFVKVDTSDAAFTAYTINKDITALPEFRFYKDGVEVGSRVVGYKKPALEKAVKALL